jgi:23S rRNA (guanosine2251-2'-O)-methyltransferase
MSKNKILFGLHAVKAALDKHAHDVIALHCSSDKSKKTLSDVLKLAKRNHVAINFVPSKRLDTLSEQGNHQGAVVEMIAMTPAKTEDLLGMLEKLDEPAFLLILDGVQDPHNLGACLRTADAAGVHAVIAPKDNAVGITATVSKVASGAAENVPFYQVTNLARTLDQLKELGIWVMGAAGEADSTVYQGDYKGSIAIVMGSEGKGMRRLTRDKCDHIYSIPMQGSVESLNVSVAAALFLYEVVRQRQ